MKSSAALPQLLLAPRDAAKALSLCEKSIFNLTKAKKLKAIKIGRSVRYSTDELRRFISAHESAPIT